MTAKLKPERYAQLPYPHNLTAALTDALPRFYKGTATTGWEITARGARVLMNEKLNERERDVVIQRWRDGKTYEEIGRIYNVTRERIRQIEVKAIRKLSYPPSLVNFACIPFSMYIDLQKRLEYAQEIIRREKVRVTEFSNEATTYFCSIETDEEDIIKPEPKPANTNDFIKSKEIEYMEFSVRSYNCLLRAGYRTIGDILQADEESFRRIRNLGKKSADEIIYKIHAIGGQMSWEVEPNDSKATNS